ncbi:MAG TPA: M56 family metallopeptidase [Rhizomicrobium sp.]|jgi:beta-lactamase regulating signal transducer with metallopeptidase domain|nr:M56 family metallopeptidase [Rhizomicrobium sp.]
MADFLLFLGKTNLALGGAVILVYLLRRPLRAQFGAPIAYAVWLLVPIAGLAVLLPPRTVAPPPAPLAPLQTLAGQYPAAPISVIGQIAHPASRIAEQLTEQSTLVHPVIAAQAAALHYGPPDYALLLFAAWAFGVVLMALYLARLQVRFHAAVRLGEAGPAVLGFFRPRLVMPDTFQEQFSAPEQAAIQAHERVHLARQDARINALAALLRCLCWFNPLIHLGAAWLRIDQELACDATALAGPVSRRDYANALLKSQMMTTLLPLGCNWPGSQHPLIERIALLKRKPPGTARRIAGTGLVMFAATFAGLGAWAAQPPVPAKAIAAPSIHKQIALAVPSVSSTTANQNAGDTGSPPVADASPMEVTVAKNIPVRKPAARAQATAPVPNSGSAEAQSLPTQDRLPERVDLALNAAADTALAKAAADAAGALPRAAAAREMVVSSGTPASVNYDPVSAMKLLSKATGGTYVCSPTAIGTVTGVHPDSLHFGTDIVLDGNDGKGRKGTFIGFVPTGNVKYFPALDTYMGKQVAIWGPPVFSRDPLAHGVEIKKAPQLQLLSTALADPKKTWCYLSPIQRQYSDTASPAAAVTVNNQPAAPMQPATSDTSAGVIAAAMPASAGSAGGNVPHPKTESGLRCLVGLEPAGCEAAFESPPVERQRMLHCTDKYVWQPGDLKADMTGPIQYICSGGPLERIKYLGTNAAGDDVYFLQFMHENEVLSLSQPGSDGKIAVYCTIPDRPNICTANRPRSNNVTSPAEQARILYTRPQEHAALQPTSPDGRLISAAAMPGDQPPVPMQPATPDPSVVPVATVNDESISDYALRQRMALFIALSGLKPNADDLKRIRGQILDQMENEKIQLQEAVNKRITVSPVEVDRAINNLLNQKHLTLDQLRVMLNQAGASESTLRSQVTAQLAWQKTSAFRPTGCAKPGWRIITRAACPPPSVGFDATLIPALPPPTFPQGGPLGP